MAMVTIRADGIPLNFRLYQVLLEALFDIDKSSIIVNEVDEDDDADSAYDSNYSKILHSTLTVILDWADIGLLAYPEFFYRGNIDLMNIVLSTGLSAAGLEKLCSSRRSTKGQQTNFNQLPALCMIAQEIIDLAFTEKEIYSPILEKWHPLAVGVAVATLHSCYGQQVKAFTSEINDLTPSVIQVHAHSSR
ncbi:protein unc-13 homolog isoform X1 [Tanacetum coccineum]